MLLSGVDANLPVGTADHYGNFSLKVSDVSVEDSNGKEFVRLHGMPSAFPEPD
jgi:hypothetical protein